MIALAEELKEQAYGNIPGRIKVLMRIAANEIEYLQMQIHNLEEKYCLDQRVTNKIGTKLGAKG